MIIQQKIIRHWDKMRIVYCCYFAEKMSVTLWPKDEDVTKKKHRIHRTNWDFQWIGFGGISLEPVSRFYPKSSWRFMCLQWKNPPFIDDLPTYTPPSMGDFPACHVWFPEGNPNCWLCNVIYPIPTIYPIDHHLWLVICSNPQEDRKVRHLEISSGNIIIEVKSWFNIFPSFRGVAQVIQSKGHPSNCLLKRYRNWCPPFAKQHVK